MLAGVFALTLGCTGVSVLFNFLGRDFYNALAEKNVDGFWHQMQVYLATIPCVIPVFVFRDFFSSKLQLQWRKWMTQSLTREYFDKRRYYKLQGGNVVDNPDQRLSADVNAFTDTALGFSLTILNCVVDLVSFSNILYSIYPPLFGVLIVYAIGGTFISLQIGKPLVEINFKQEKTEADYRYSLVRIRDNAESIAFFRGERKEIEMLDARLQVALDNALRGILKSRDLSFFQSFYRYIIQLLPAAVIAPLFFRGEIEFGVINQSASAFSHILTDVSLVVFQFESLAGFSATVDRLGQFVEALEAEDDPLLLENAAAGLGQDEKSTNTASSVAAEAVPMEPAKQSVHYQRGESGMGASDDETILRVEDLSLLTPDGETKLTDHLNLSVQKGDSLLVIGRSGVGKTSVLRAMAGLWNTGQGTVTRFHRKSGGSPGATEATADTSTRNGNGAVDESGEDHDVFFLPQRPYMVLGTLRDQLLYPYNEAGGTSSETKARQDEELCEILREVLLGDLLDRCETETTACGLDADMDWGSSLSLGEQQRLAFARLLVNNPSLAILDESTSALDVQSEEQMYALLKKFGISYLSVGHRPTLLKYHSSVLQLKRENDAYSAFLMESEDMDMETYLMSS